MCPSFHTTRPIKTVGQAGMGRVDFGSTQRVNEFIINFFSNNTMFNFQRKCFYIKKDNIPILGLH